MQNFKAGEAPPPPADKGARPDRRTGPRRRSCRGNKEVRGAGIGRMAPGTARGMARTSLAPAASRTTVDGCAPDQTRFYRPFSTAAKPIPESSSSARTRRTRFAARRPPLLGLCRSRRCRVPAALLPVLRFRLSQSAANHPSNPIITSFQHKKGLCIFPECVELKHGTHSRKWCGRVGFHLPFWLPPCF